MDYMKAVGVITSAMSESGDPLSGNQVLILAGSMAVIFNKTERGCVSCPISDEYLRVFKNLMDAAAENGHESLRHEASLIYEKVYKLKHAVER